MKSFFKQIICGFKGHDFWMKFVNPNSPSVKGLNGYTKFKWDSYQTTEEWYCIECGKISHKDHSIELKSIFDSIKLINKEHEDLRQMELKNLDKKG